MVQAALVSTDLHFPHYGKACLFAAYYFYYRLAIYVSLIIIRHLA